MKSIPYFINMAFLIPYSRYARNLPCLEKRPYLLESLDTHDTPCVIGTEPPGNLLYCGNTGYIGVKTSATKSKHVSATN